MDTRSTKPHSQTASASASHASCQHLGPLADQPLRVTFEQRFVVLAHRDREVVLALRSQSFGIDELELAVARLERVPSVGVAVHQHRLRLVERVRPGGAEVQRAVDHCCGRTD